MLGSQVTPLTLNALRWVVATGVLFPLAWSREGQHLKKWRSHWPTLLAMGATGVLGFNSLVYLAVRYTTATNATLINTAAPLIISFFSFLLGLERPARRQVAGMLLGTCGVVWILFRGDLHKLLALQPNLGDALMVAAILLWSFYSLAARKVMHYLPNLTATAVSSLLGTCMLVPVSLWEAAHAGIKLNAQVILGAAYLGIFCSVLAFLWWNYGMASLGPGRAAAFLYLTPFFTAILSRLLLHEALEKSQVVGGLLIIAGVYLTTSPPLRGVKVAKSGCRCTAT